VPEAEWFNKTIDIDTGCVFGGDLTALRYPEEDLVAVQAKKVYAEPAKPLQEKGDGKLSLQQEYDDLLDIDHVIGNRIIQTRLKNNISIREENSIAALEVMSRFAINPKWLIYLPPTMSPCATSELPEFLEHPEQAIDYYKKRGISKIICEEKHMGSRAVLVVCRDEGVALQHFGVKNEGIGVCYTRTGRNFFTDPQMEKEFLDRVNRSLTLSGFWERLHTDWVCLDTEIMPWSAKAQLLIKDQYASVGAAARNALSEVEQALQKTADRSVAEANPALEKFTDKKGSVSKFIQAYRNYCWEINSIDDYKIAPFHVLATEGAVHVDKTHQWHMETIREICMADEKLFRSTPYRIVDPQDSQSYQAALDWWLELTEKGGEGMVVKSYDFLAFSKDGLLQPAIKCRGSEYLRIIYGPEYDRPENLERLKNRGLSKKRALALKEFALGIEALERFVNKEPLRRIHESVFGVLAIESEEVDPRL
jgi:protein phosphatase